MMPVQKSGIDCPAMVRTLAPSSRLVSARLAIHTPSGMATTMVSRMAATARVMVYGQPVQHHVQGGCLEGVRRAEVSGGTVP